jgi:hypothetical protein
MIINILQNNPMPHFPLKISIFLFIFTPTKPRYGMSAASPLSNLQLELLKLYSSNVSEADLLHIRDYLARYFAFKAIGEADKVWDEKAYTNDTMDQWLNEDDSSYGNKDSH